MTKVHVTSIARQCVIYLSNQQPLLVQQMALSLYRQLMIADGNGVWWYLVSAARCVPSPPSLPPASSSLLASLLIPVINNGRNPNLLPVPIRGAHTNINASANVGSSASGSANAAATHTNQYTTNVDILLRDLRHLPEPQLTSFW